MDGLFIKRLFSLILALSILPFFVGKMDSFLPVDHVPICDIQGESTSSPYLGQIIETRGIVFADLDETAREGFFMADTDCDENPATSDGIFVYLGDRNQYVSSGDEVAVVGKVYEYYGLTDLVVDPANLTVLSSGNPLPAAVELAARRRGRRHVRHPLGDHPQPVGIFAYLVHDVKSETNQPDSFVSHLQNWNTKPEK